jgi:phage tail-like protein
MPDPKTNPYRKFAFTVEIDGMQVAGFRKASGLSVEMQPEEYREGGVNDYVHKLPGQYTHRNLVLERGLTESTKLWDWVEGVRTGEFYAASSKRARKDVTVTLRAGYNASASKAWQFRNAYPVTWEGPELAADAGGSSAVAVQRVEFAHEGFTRTSR